MSKSLSSIKNKEELEKVVSRRLLEKRGGLGDWAAIDYVEKHKSKQAKAEK